MYKIVAVIQVQRTDHLRGCNTIDISSRDGQRGLFEQLDADRSTVAIQPRANGHGRLSTGN